jgi:hypothetical protein
MQNQYIIFVPSEIVQSESPSVFISIASNTGSIIWFHKCRNFFASLICITAEKDPMPYNQLVVIYQTSNIVNVEGHTPWN